MTHSVDHAMIKEIEDALEHVEKDMEGFGCSQQEIEEMAAAHMVQSREVQSTLEERAFELIQIWKQQDDIEATDRRAWAREKSRQLNSMN